MARRQRQIDGSAFKNLPNEMFFQIFSYLNKRSVLNARSTCRKWKAIVDETSDLNFCCHITDDSIMAAINSEMRFPLVKIHDFLGNGNGVVSGTRGTGRILRAAEQIKITGPNLNPSEVSRIMLFGMRTLKEVIFHRANLLAIESVISSKSVFESLQKLSLTFNTFPRDSHTAIFKTLADRNESRSRFMPCLSELRIRYEMDSIEELYSLDYVPLPHTMLNNYISIFNLIISLKRSLKIVEVARNEVMRTALVLRVDMGTLRVGERIRERITACVRELQEVHLEELHLTPLMDEGEYPWILEGTLLRNQRGLRCISLNRKLCAPRPGAQNLRTLLPQGTEFYTTVKLSMTCFGNAPVDVSVFGQCPSLKILWLAFYRGVRIGPARNNTLHFSNIESLPTGITSLHFKSSQQDPIIIHQQTILAKTQIAWIIQNMRELDSFWLQLVAEEMNIVEAAPVAQAQNPQPVNHNPVEVRINEGNDGADNADAELQDAQNLVNQLNNELNANANINLQTFRELLSLPKLKDMKFDMLKAEQLGARLEVGADGNPWILPMGMHVSVADIREYLQVISEFPKFTYRTQAATFFPFGFIELTINKK